MNNETMRREPGLLRPALTLLAVASLVTGLAYPLAVTGVAQVLMPLKAGGSLVLHQGRAVGSALIGQAFTGVGHFWGRPSATAPQPYNAAASGGANLGPLNPALADAIRARVAALRAADPGNLLPIPVDLVTSSASGLDPHISPAAALWQAARVARARGLPLADVQALIALATTPARWGGVLGEAQVNVLQLNLALDTLRSVTSALDARRPPT